MFCTNCGNKLEDDALFCSECGAKVAKAESPDLSEQVLGRTAPVNQKPKIPESLSSGRISSKNSSFSNMELMALVAAVLSFIFALCSIRLSMAWVTMIAALVLAFMCFVRFKFDHLFMAVPISIFALGVLINSIMAFRFFKYSGFIGSIMVIIPMLCVVGAAAAYWLMVLNIGDRRKMVVATTVLIALYAIICITSALSGGALLFRVAANRLAAVLFMIAYILRIADNGEAFAVTGVSYKELGGYLKFTVYGGIIVSIIGIIVTIIEMVQVFRLLRVLRMFGGGSFLQIVSVILMFASITLYGLIIWFLIKIKNRDQSFLWFYHKLAIALTLVSFIMHWITVGFGTGFMYLIFYGLMFFLYTLYFVKSVRVRTYMQSDEYLRIDPLTRNVPSPQPADM